MKPNEYKLISEKRSAPWIWRWIEGDARYPLQYFRWKHQKEPMVDVDNCCDSFESVLNRHTTLFMILSKVYFGEYYIGMRDNRVVDVDIKEIEGAINHSNIEPRPMVSHMAAHCSFSLIIYYMGKAGISFEDRFVRLIPDDIVSHSVYSTGRLDIDDYLKRVQIGLNTIFMELDVAYRVVRYNKAMGYNSYVRYPMGAKSIRDQHWVEPHISFEFVDMNNKESRNAGYGPDCTVFLWSIEKEWLNNPDIDATNTDLDFKNGSFQL